MTRKFPHLRGCTALRVPEGVDARDLLRGQLAVSATSADGASITATGMCALRGFDDRLLHSCPNLAVLFMSRSCPDTNHSPYAKNLVMYLGSHACCSMSTPSRCSPRNVDVGFLMLLQA